MSVLCNLALRWDPEPGCEFPDKESGTVGVHSSGEMREGSTECPGQRRASSREHGGRRQRQRPERVRVRVWLALGLEMLGSVP